MIRFPSSSLAISLMALAVALGGTSFAQHAAYFILGVINKTNTQSGIVSPVNGSVLSLNNASTGANATALGLFVKPGHPPMIVNSSTRVRRLNADKLDDFEGNAYGRVLGLRQQKASGAVDAGRNLFLIDPFTPISNGRCEVIASTQITFEPFDGPVPRIEYRAAIKRGASPAVDDGPPGDRFLVGDFSDFLSNQLTRVAVFNVTAGQSTRFGVLVDIPLGFGVGGDARVNVAYYCTTVGPNSGSAHGAGRSR